MSAPSESPRPKPKLRGVAHVISALLAVPATVLLVQHARSPAMEVGALTYGLSLTLLLSASGLYHTPMWKPIPRMRLRRLDRSMIYVLIAGSYTPFLLALDHVYVPQVLTAVWVVAAVGIVSCLLWVKAPRVLTASPYLLLGWVIVPFAATFLRQLGIAICVLIAVGGLAYTVGAVIYARRTPDPWPATFGYHEIFHVLVTGASVCHYAAVWQTVG